MVLYFLHVSQLCLISYFISCLVFSRVYIALPPFVQFLSCVYAATCFSCDFLYCGLSSLFLFKNKSAAIRSLSQIFFFFPDLPWKYILNTHNQSTSFKDRVMWWFFFAVSWFSSAKTCTGNVSTNPFSLSSALADQKPTKQTKLIKRCPTHSIRNHPVRGKWKIRGHIWGQPWCRSERTHENWRWI